MTVSERSKISGSEKSFHSAEKLCESLGRFSVMTLQRSSDVEREGFAFSGRHFDFSTKA